jgi:hypothetical protein
MRGILVAILIIGGTACINPNTYPPVPARPTGAITHTGLVAQFYGAASNADLTTFASWGPITTRSPVTTVDQARQILDASAGYVQVLLLVETDNRPLVTALAAAPDVLSRAAAIELGNELDASLTGAQFGQFVTWGYQTLRAAGFTGDIISGGVGNVELNNINWLQAAGIASWPKDLIFGFHVYRQGANTNTVQGYADRTHEAEAIYATAAGHPLAMTEFGYKHNYGATEDQIASWVDADFTEWYSLACKYMFLYQLNDGTDPTNLFGVRDINLVWRPLMVGELQKWAGLP